MGRTAAKVRARSRTRIFRLGRPQAMRLYFFFFFFFFFFFLKKINSLCAARDPAQARRAIPDIAGVHPTPIVARREKESSAGARRLRRTPSPIVKTTLELRGVLSMPRSRKPRGVLVRVARPRPLPRRSAEDARTKRAHFTTNTLQGASSTSRSVVLPMTRL